MVGSVLVVETVKFVFETSKNTFPAPSINNRAVEVALVLSGIEISSDPSFAVVASNVAVTGLVKKLAPPFVLR